MATPGISESHCIDQMVIRCIAKNSDASIDLINFSESHTQSQPFRPLPCDNYHDHSILTHICWAAVARLLVLAYGTANAIMQVWNGSIYALVAVGKPATIVTLMMMSSKHLFLFYMYDMYQIFLDFNRFPGPHIHIQSFTPLPWGWWSSP